MAGPPRPKLVASVTKMVKRAAYYGKKKTNDLAAAFDKLTLTPEKKSYVRVPLTPTSANAAPLSAQAAGQRPDQAVSPHSRHKPVIPQLPVEQPEKVTEIAAARPKFDPNDEITALTSLDYVDPSVKDFNEFVKLLATHFNITKIAQGSFGVVYRMEMTTRPEVYTIWKLMAIKPRKGKGSRAPDQTTIENATAEVKALAFMQEIHGFVDFRSAQVLRGLLPQPLVKFNEEWEAKHCGDTGEMGSSPDQLWLFVEMSDAGTDLETVLRDGFPDGSRLNKRSRGSRLTIKQTWDIFWGITETLARAEGAADFEHRDLHAGNVCVTNSPIRAEGEDQHQTERYTNLRVTLIDYTLSRATLEDGEVLANSMSDPQLFEQAGTNETDNRQYETYRKMRVAVTGVDANVKSRLARWEDFVPVTNAFWLYYLLQLLLDETELYPQFPTKGQEARWFQDEKERHLAKRLTKILIRLRRDHRDEWQYDSATDVITIDGQRKEGDGVRG